MSFRGRVLSVARSFLSRIVTKFFIVLALIVIPLPSLLLLIFLFIPIHISRWFVSVLALFHPGLVRLVSKRSAIFAPELMLTGRNLECANIGCFIVEGEIQLEQVQTKFMEKVLYAEVVQDKALTRPRDSDSTNTNAGGDLESKRLMYPELAQYIRSWLGFYFWCNEPNFDLSQHIKSWGVALKESLESGVEIDCPDLESICSQIITQPFPDKTSPWEIYVVSKVKIKSQSQRETASALVFRMHHALADGQSLLKMLARLIDGMELEHTFQHQPANREMAMPMPSNTSSNRINSIIRLALQLTLLPYHAVTHLIESFDLPNFWKRKPLTRDLIVVKSEEIPIDKIKHIKNQIVGCVSFAAVVNAGICGGMRSYQLKVQNKAAAARKTGLTSRGDHNGDENIRRNWDIPSKIHMMIAIVQQKMTNVAYLRNHFFAGFIKLPIGTQRPKTRLKLINENLNRFTSSGQYSLFLSLTPLLIRLVGGLPSYMLTKVTFNQIPSGALSYLRIPGNNLVYDSKRIQNCFFVVSTFYGSSGISFSIGSWNDHVQISIAVDQAIISTREQVQELKDTIVQEFDILSCEFCDNV